MVFFFVFYFFLQKGETGFFFKQQVAALNESLESEIKLKINQLSKNSKNKLKRDFQKR